jgi:hypothetical protein
MRHTLEKEFSHIHIPKCGGSWIDDFFHHAYPESLIHSSHGTLSNLMPCYWIAWRTGTGPMRDGHPIWDVDYAKKPLRFEMRNVAPPTHPGRFEKSILFSTCRNPFDWLVSYYYSNFGDVNNIHGIRSFEEFVKKFCDPDFKWFHYGLHKFAFFQMFDHEGKGGVQWILRMEKLKEAITMMLLNYGADGKYLKERWDTFGHDHATRDSGGMNPLRPHKDHRFYYDDHHREIVTKRFEAELLLYRYNFDGPTDHYAIVDIPHNWGPLISDPFPGMMVMNRK